MFFPHIFVWGSCFWLVVHSRPPPACLPPAACLTHDLLTYNLLTHRTYSHTTCPHTTCSHTTYSHTTYSHTQLAHTQLAHTQLAHTQLHTTYSHTTCTQLTHTQLVHTQLTHPRLGTWRHRPSLCVARMALGDIDRHFAWQAWRLWNWGGSGGAWFPFCAVGAAAVCVAGVALATSTFTLRGRRGTWRHRPSLCMAGVALMALGWLWWCAWFPFVAVDAGAVCVAGVWHLEASTSILCG